MIKIFSGSQEIKKKIGNPICGNTKLRPMKYCYTLSVEEGKVIYNSITGCAILLNNEEDQTFLCSDEAISEWFSVPLDMNEEPYFVEMLGSIWALDPNINISKINDIILSLYIAYIQEKQLDESRQEIYTSDRIAKWMSQYGSPLYVFRKADFIAFYKNMEQTFQKEYPKYQIAYSYKTNYTPAICHLIKELGGYAEVVSDFELFVARNLGYDDTKIIYNGPCKGASVEQFLLNGGLLNIESIDEFERICSIAKLRPNSMIEVGLRLNFDVGQNQCSRFGIDANDSTIIMLLNRAIKLGNVKIVGLHFHSEISSIFSWKKRIEKILYLVKNYFSKDLKYIDLGSGMHIRTFYDKGIPIPDDIRTIESYAKVAIKPIADYYRDFSDDEKPLLFTEPGTLLIKKSVDFIATIQYLKNNNGKQFVVVDGSKLNLGNESYNDHRPIMVLNKKECINLVKCHDADIVGYTCMESDRMYVGLNENVAKGGYVVFCEVGAYSTVKKPQFIMPNGAMISFNGGDNIHMIKRQEEYSDFLTTYVTNKHEED